MVNGGEQIVFSQPVKSMNGFNEFRVRGCNIDSTQTDYHIFSV
jgi:hypothetical protein